MWDSISKFVTNNLSTYGLDTNLNNYVKNQLPNICDAAERSKSFQIPSGYLVEIGYYNADSTIGNGVIKANMPKQIDFTIASNWLPLLDENFSHKFVDFLTTTGFSTVVTKNQNLSMLRWAGTSPLKLTLELNFIANNRSEVKEKIIDPIIKISRLTLPQVNSGGYYSPPGPHFSVDFSERTFNRTGGTTIDVRIGDYMFLSNVIIQQARVSLPSILGDLTNPKDLVLDLFNSNNSKDIGNKISSYMFSKSTETGSMLAPMRANITIGIETMEALTANMISTIFNSMEISSAKAARISGED